MKTSNSLAVRAGSSLDSDLVTTGEGAGLQSSLKLEVGELGEGFNATLQKFVYTATPDTRSLYKNAPMAVSPPSMLARASPHKKVVSKSITAKSTPVTKLKTTTKRKATSNAKLSKAAIGVSELAHPAPISRIPKRKFDDTDDPDGFTLTNAKRRTTTKERAANDPYNPPNKLVDSLQPGLMLVMIGLNPGLDTAKTGHAYANPTNMFWKLMHLSGITPIKHQPREYRDLVDLYRIGNTNLCSRPTRAGDGLTEEEKKDGFKLVEQKIAEMRPEAVCIVGKGIWDVIYKAKTGKPLKKGQFKWGWQDEKLWLGRQVEDSEILWKGARTFVSTSTSGLDAGTKPPEKLAIWKRLGEWVASRRLEEALEPVKNQRKPGEEPTYGEGQGEFTDERRNQQQTC